MKISDIPGAGFGVFAMQLFRPREFVTVYLGVKRDETYQFKDIVARPKKFKLDIMDDEYWLAHRINHGSGDSSNVEIGNDYVIRATKNISIGDELLLDYNRDCICKKCKGYKFFQDQDDAVMDNCINCGNLIGCKKSCKTCRSYMCFECYDHFQFIM